jgi:membrane protein DedA with SNARE-associated domain
MAEDALQAEALAEGDSIDPPPPRKIVLDMPSWIPTEKVPRRLLIALILLFLTALIVGTTVPFALDWVNQDDLEGWGYPGIFLANFLGTATVFVPVPGLTAAGQTLIVVGSESLLDVGVVAAGASGMTLAESTAYLAGVMGRNAAEERDVQLKGRFGGAMRKIASWIDWLMARYGFLTLLTLSAIPNPFFEFAGITAGAVRMNFWRFLIAVGIGKTTRVILLVIIGQALIDFFELDL